MKSLRPLTLLMLLGLAMALIATAACEPLVPTAAYVVVSETPPPPTATFTPSITPTPSDTPPPTETGIPTATPTATPQPCTETQGFILNATFYSEIQQADVFYRIYFPPCYMQTQRRYPYVILLHGLEGQGQPAYTGDHWLDLGVADALDRGITLGHLPPMVLVLPDGNRIHAQNTFGPGEGYEAVIVDELIPTLEDPNSGYCLWTAREGRAIGGISRGGFWAFEIAFRHPEIFSAVGGHSAYFDSSAPDAYNPLFLAENTPAEYLSSLRIYLDHGADDYVQPLVGPFSDALEARQIAHDYVVNITGTHSDEYWGNHLTEYLAFYGEQWPDDAYQLPSCLEPVGD